MSDKGYFDHKFYEGEKDIHLVCNHVLFKFHDDFLQFKYSKQFKHF